MLYEIGDVIRCSVEFRDLNGVLGDPDTVVFKHKDPSANIATITYPTDIVRTAAGLYYYDLTIDEGGTWSIRWVASGTIDAAGEKTLTVRTSAF